MPTCCPCTSNGKCVRCICVRAGRECIDCCPSRQSPQRCENLEDRDPRHVQSNQSADSQPEQPSRLPICSPSSPTLASDPHLRLPEYELMSETNFVWGALDGPSVAHSIDCAYAEIVHWKRNLFLLPSGKAGRDFIREQTRLLSSYAESKPIERIALKAAMTMPSLLLQKPCASSKAKDHAKCLERRLHLWFAGDMDSLLVEGRIIQQHLTQSAPKHNNQQDRLTRTFARLMFEGRV